MNLTEAAQKAIARMQEDGNAEINDYLAFLLKAEDIIVRGSDPGNVNERLSLLVMSKDLAEFLTTLKA